jgi:hypothetical protein
MMLVTGPSLRDWRASIGIRPSLLSETGARILPRKREVLQPDSAHGRSCSLYRNASQRGVTPTLSAYHGALRPGIVDSRPSPETEV